MYLRSRLLVVYLRSPAVKKLIPIRTQLSTDQKRRWESSTLTLLLPQLLIFSYSVFFFLSGWADRAAASEMQRTSTCSSTSWFPA